MADFSRTAVSGRVGRMEQLAAVRRYVIDDGKGRGMRAFVVTNAGGIDFTVYPDRGLDIGPARFEGRPLAWQSPNGPVAPAFYDDSGFAWLRSWMGGLVTTCGWLNVGTPCETAFGTEGLHGRADHIPAEEVNARAFWNAAGEYELEISGRIVHSRVFGEKLVTARTIRTCLGRPFVELVDRTTNEGGATLPLMQLYHMNFGWPLADEGTRILAPEHSVTPRDAAAEKGLAEWDRFPAPEADFAEQVFYHDLPSDDAGDCTVRIVNPKFGADVVLSFRKRELPYLVQWRMPGRGEYVMGLEPGNCFVEGQAEFARRGLLRHIEPGETVETRLRIGVERR